MTSVFNDNRRNTTTRRRSRLVAGLVQKRASRSDRKRARRTALAMSEEARIHAQVQHHQMRLAR